MKKHILTTTLLTACLIVAGSLLLAACGGGGGKKEGSEATNRISDEKPAPLNISIILDLSDRIMRDNVTPTQTDRDTAIVAYLADWFKAQTLGPQILKSENKIKVFFYPIPKNSEIATLAESLSLDMGELNPADRRKNLETMKATFMGNLSQIYRETLEEKHFIGCDIWDFFSNKKVDQLCIKPGARNIVVILTDGYLFQANHKLKEGNAYSYILPTTLKEPNSSLIVKRKGLDNIEVLMLEVNPYEPAQRDRLVEVLENWFRGMGVQKFTVAETDVPTNTKTIIKNFLN